MSGVYDTRITAYFGDAVMQAGFMPVPHLFLRHYRQLGLSHVQAMFALQLMEIAWDVARPPTSVSKLAERMGVGHRTIQLCSKELHALALIDIYDQFDDEGAQIENGYDLSPLFRRLATFAPTERPSGEARVRRPRTRPGEEPAPVGDTPPVDLYTTPVQEITPALRADDHRGGVVDNTPPVIVASGLNRELKKHPKKQTKKTTRNKQPVAAVVFDNDATESAATSPVTGHSLRWNLPLSALEVAASREVLRTIGLNALVVDGCAAAMHPAECWALWCYARGACLGVPWIASQIFDFHERQARLTAHAQIYDDVGRRLAALPTTEAAALVVASGQHNQHRLSPDDEQPAGVPTDHAALLEAIGVLRSEQTGKLRNGAGANTATQQGGSVKGAACPAGGSQLDDPLWSSVRARLEQQIEHREFVTWIMPLTLLDRQEQTAYIAAPNVFVRNEVAERWSETIAGAIHEATGDTVEVVVVIGSAHGVAQS